VGERRRTDKEEARKELYCTNEKQNSLIKQSESRIIINTAVE